MGRRNLKLLLLCLPIGCSPLYTMRTNRFISPEAQGRLGGGRFSMGFSRSQEVDTPAADDERSTLDDYYPVSTINFALGLAERWDLFVATQSGSSGTYLGAKYQFLGQSRKAAKAGSFSLAGTIAPGWTRINPDDGSSTEPRGNAWMIDASLIAGYRPADKLLFYGGPFYTHHSLDATRPDGESVSGSGDQFGANLAARLEWKHFAIEVEGVWSTASWNDSRNSLASIGFALSALW